jgi:hypothetical protein
MRQQVEYLVSAVAQSINMSPGAPLIKTLAMAPGPRRAIAEAERLGQGNWRPSCYRPRSLPRGRLLALVKRLRRISRRPKPRENRL